jgi:cytidylate kinase
MKPIRSLDVCKSFVECQSMRSPDLTAPSLPVVTISRATGARGVTISDLLCTYLQQNEPDPSPPWTVFDRNLIEQVLADHDLPASMAKFMPEDSLPMVSSAIEELLGLHPSPYDQVRQTAETIVRLSQMGRVILVGRGGQALLANLPQALHVRLTGSKNRRAQHLSEYYHLSPSAALEMLEREDAAQRRYLRTHYHSDIDDPLLYHMVIDTDRLSSEDVATMIGDAAFRLMQRLEESAQATQDESVEATSADSIAQDYSPVPTAGAMSDPTEE